MPRKKTQEILTLFQANPKYTVDLVGHKDIEQKFITEWNNREQKGFHHAWLLCGDYGIGKATLAYRMARFVFKTMHSGGLFGQEILNTMDETEDDVVYQKMKNGGLGDLFVVSSVKEDGSRKSISVDEIRDLIDKVHLTSMEGEWRVCIVDKLDDLNVSCSNALLKVLEEPPAKTLFILLADQLNNVLPTVRSRVHIEKLKPLSDLEMKSLLQAKIPDLYQLDVLTFLSGGSVANALNIYTCGGMEFLELTSQILYNKDIKTGDVLDFCSYVEKQSDKFKILVSILLNVIHKKALENPSSKLSFDLANNYSMILQKMRDTTAVYLDYENILFNLIMEIRKCL